MSLLLVHQKWKTNTMWRERGMGELTMTVGDFSLALDAERTNRTGKDSGDPRPL